MHCKRTSSSGYPMQHDDEIDRYNEFKSEIRLLIFEPTSVINWPTRVYYNGNSLPTAVNRGLAVEIFYLQNCQNSKRRPNHPNVVRMC